MQMFGVGILELMVILMLTVIVVGPDRMPQVAADLARWIRQGRAYARHLMGDFNSVISDLEKEANINREDWKEISSVITRHTGDIGKELTKVTKEVQQAGDLAEAKLADPAPANGASADAAQNGNGNGAHAESTQPEAAAEPEPAEEKPWYVPEKPSRASRRRSSE